MVPGSVKKLYYRELTSWGLMAFALAAVEGGVTGVLINHIFATVVSNFWLSQAVGLVAGAPAMANLLSPLWARVEQGRDKIQLVSMLGVGLALSLVVFATAPVSRAGLIQVTAAVVSARIFWSGILIVRSNLWRANYPRFIRAKITASLALTMSLIMAATGFLIGWTADVALLSARGLYFLLAILGLSGALYYRRLELRNARQLAVAERALRQREGAFGLRTIIAVLKHDKAYRRYMRIMFIFGSGNLMFIAPLILIINQQMSVSQLHQVLITSSIPLAALPLSIRWWAKKLDRTHVVLYRARHAWSFVAAIAMFALAAGFNQEWMLWVGALLFGTAIAGAVLGWNLGHHDFAAPERAARYMAVHVTLTGVRGLVMPILGVNLYQIIRSVAPDLARYTLFIPLIFSLVGALMFVHLAARLRRADSVSAAI